METTMTDADVLRTMQEVVDNNPWRWNPMTATPPNSPFGAYRCLYQLPRPGVHFDDCHKCIIGEWLNHIGQPVPEKEDVRGVSGIFEGVEAGTFVYLLATEEKPLAISTDACFFLYLLQMVADADSRPDTGERYGWRWSLEKTMKSARLETFLKSAA